MGLAWCRGYQCNAHHVVTSPATHHHCPLANSKLCCLVTRDNSENTSNWRDDPPAPTTGRENRNTYSRVVRASFVSSASSCGPTMSGSWWVPSKCRSVTRKFSPVFKNHERTNLCLHQLLRSNLYKSFPPQVMFPHLPALCQIVHYVRYLLLHWILRYEYHKVRMSSWGAAEWHVTSYLTSCTRQPTTFCHRTNENKVYDWWTSSLNHSQITSRQKHMPRT